MGVLVERPIDLDFTETPLKQLDEEVLLKGLELLHQVTW